MIMELHESKTASKALYLQAAALSGLSVSPDSPERLADIVYEGYYKVADNYKPKAVANLLRLIAATLDIAQENNDSTLFESTVNSAQTRVCPVYPFD